MREIRESQNESACAVLVIFYYVILVRIFEACVFLFVVLFGSFVHED